MNSRGQNWTWIPGAHGRAAGAALALAALLAAVALGTATAQAQTFVVFEAGGSVGQGTSAIGINTAGDVVGDYFEDYFDTGNVFHGFVRSTDGTITTFEAPAQARATVKGQ